MKLTHLDTLEARAVDIVAKTALVGPSPHGVFKRNANVSTWGFLPNAGPRVMAVFDEFSNLADALPNNEREELW